MIKIPEVSIIMNCYNGEQYLCEAIKSALAQTFKNWELIFWDNKSEDGSAKIAKSFRDDRIRYYCAKKTTPLGEARNNAIKQSKGRYIAFLDCDDLYTPNSLGLRMSMMQEGCYGMVYGAAIRINGAGRRTGFYPARLKSGIILTGLLAKYEIAMSAVLINKKILITKTKGFPPLFKFCPDYHLFLEIASKYKIAVINKPVAAIRRGSHNLTLQLRTIAGSEMHQSLRNLLQHNRSKNMKQCKAFKIAHSKANLYYALELYLKNQKKKAIFILKSNSNYLFFSNVLLFLIYIKIPPAALTWLVNFKNI